MLIATLRNVATRVRQPVGLCSEIHPSIVKHAGDRSLVAKQQPESIIAQRGLPEQLLQQAGIDDVHLSQVALALTWFPARRWRRHADAIPLLRP